jgi:hypothetical protein
MQGRELGIGLTGLDWIAKAFARWRLNPLQIKAFFLLDIQKPFRNQSGSQLFFNIFNQQLGCLEGILERGIHIAANHIPASEVPRPLANHANNDALALV